MAKGNCTLAIFFAFLLFGTGLATAQEMSILERVEGEFTLQRLEEMALQSNPTIAQSEAAIRAAEGRKKQSGLYPNPTVGVLVEELSQRDPQGKSDAHFFFFADQTLVLGGKRGKAADLFEAEKQQSQTQAEAQKQRVLNSVRILYYRLLGAQQQVRVREKLLRLAEEAAQITKELLNVGAADRPDDLEAEIEVQAAEVAALSARNERERLWRDLATVIGKPDLPVATVSGTLDYVTLQLERDQLLDQLLKNSPQIKSAEQQLQRAKAAVSLAKAQRIPDLSVGGGVGYNYERLPGTDEPVGLEAFFQVGIPLPLFNRNQGNIAVAEAEVERSEKEIQRVKLELTSRFVKLYTQFSNSKTMAQKYGEGLLPRARDAYALYLGSFRQMAAAYPQVLIAQRNQYQLEVEYVDALTDLWTAAIQLQGFLLSEGALEAPTFPGFQVENNIASEGATAPGIR